MKRLCASARIAKTRHRFCSNKRIMTGLHSATKGQREVIRQLVHSVMLRDMGTFNPERFREWIKGMDANFRKMALTLTFKIHDREVYFAVKEIRSGRTVYHFYSSTRVRFEARDVVMSYDQIAAIKC
jgi:hypothetical protein